MRAETDSLRATLHRIGSRHALETPVIVTAFVVFMLMAVANGQFRLKGAPVPNLESGVLAAAIGSAVLLLARATVLPVAARPSRPLVVAAVFAGSGAIFGLSRMALAYVFDLPIGTLLDRLVLPSLFLWIALSAVSEWLASRAEQRGMLEQLLADNERLTRLRASYAEQTAKFRNEIDEQVRNTLGPLVTEIRGKLTGLDASRASEVRDASELLLLAARDVVRPLSHRLAEPDLREFEVESSGPRIASAALAFPRVVDIPASLNPPHAGLAAVILAAVSAVAPPAADANSPAPLFVLYLYNVCSAILVWPAIAIIRATWPRRWAVLPTTLAFPLMMLVFGVALVSRRVLFAVLVAPSYIQLIVASNLAIAVVSAVAMGMLLSIEGVTRQHRADVWAAVQAVNEELNLEIARLRKELWHSRSAMSRLLHGPVQSALLSTAAVLSLPEISNDRLELHRQIIEEAIAELRSGRTESHRLAPAIDELVRVWGFSCEVRVEVPEPIRERLDEDEATTQALTSILREAVSNAVRHGRATSIDITLEPAGERLLRVRVADNGAGLPEPYQPGLGTAMLDETTYAWSRSSSGSGTELVAELSW